ncbi:MAG: hypothetical protein WA162_08680 [Thermodesulfobacteriota bacterium]
MSFWRIAKSTGNPRSRDEKNVVECYSESVRILEGEGYSGIQSFKSDPPDCIGYDSTGSMVAFEVTELTDQDAERENDKKGQRQYYRDWDILDLAQAIKDRISDKDSKSYHAGPYKKILLIIYTDELVITEDMVKKAKALLDFNKCEPRNLTEVIFLLSYEPNPIKIDYPYFNIYP